MLNSRPETPWFHEAADFYKLSCGLQDADIFWCGLGSEVALYLLVNKLALGKWQKAFLLGYVSILQNMNVMPIFSAGFIASEMTFGGSYLSYLKPLSTKIGREHEKSMVGFGVEQEAK